MKERMEYLLERKEEKSFTLVVCQNLNAPIPDFWWLKSLPLKFMVIRHFIYCQLIRGFKAM